MKKFILFSVTGLVLFSIACVPREDKQTLKEKRGEKRTDVRIYPKDTPLPEGFSPEELKDGISVASHNKRYSAMVYPQKNLIVVYEVEWRGNIGRRKMLWTMENRSPGVWLSNDGEHIVVEDEGKGIVPPNAGEDWVAFSFFERGTLIRQVKLNELIVGPSRVPKEDSPHRWGSSLGLNAAGHFVVETTDKKKIVFNVQSGDLVQWKPQRIASLPGWKAYREVMRCYEFLYPGDYRIHEVLDRSGRPTGYLYLGSIESERMIEIEEVVMFDLPRDRHDPDVISFEKAAVDRAKLMYSADGPDSSQWADSVEGMESFANLNGLKILKFSLTVLSETYIEDEKEPETTRRTEGPLFVVLISLPGEPSRFLIFRLTDRGEEIAMVKETLKSIVGSVRILE
jgi:hypothetical protein